MVAPLSNLQEFYAALRGYAAQRYRTLSKEYVFYYPGRLRTVLD